MVALYEKYRPTDFTEVVGQERAMLRLAVLKKTCGLEGQVIWLTGESGMGKTTIARLIAANTASEFTTYEIDAQDLNLETIRDWEAKAQYKSLYGGYSFIVNESHGLSNKAVSRLQTVLEDSHVQKNTTWVFTTTNQGQELLFGSKFDACPFLSRAVGIELASGDNVIRVMAQRVLEISQAEAVDGKPLSDYIALMKSCNGNMRKALQRIAAGEMLL